MQTFLAAQLQACKVLFISVGDPTGTDVLAGVASKPDSTSHEIISFFPASAQQSGFQTREWNVHQGGDGLFASVSAGRTRARFGVWQWTYRICDA